MIVGYRSRALSALKWSLSGAMAVQAIGFLFGVALARLLSPREFGLMAMLTVLTQFATAVSQLGFEEALIQNRDLTEAHRSSVFWVMLLGGVALAAGLVACAPWIAAFYATAELERLAALLSLALVLRALGTVPRAIVLRRLDFRTIVTLQCIGAAVGGTCAVVLALSGFGPVSLIANVVVVAAVETVLLFGASAWRPHLLFRVAALRELFGFGAHRLATRGLNYWAQHIDQLLIGKFIGSEPLGLYAKAHNLVRLPVIQISRATVRVMFPSLALIQDDRERVRAVYLRATGAVAVATFPMCLGIFAAAEPLVIGVLGPQWAATVPIVRLLSFAAVAQSVTTLASTLYLSLGRPDLQLRLTAVQRLTAIAAIAIGLQWGVLGVATARVLAAVLNALPTLYFAGRLVGLRTSVVLAHAAPVLLAGAVMAGVVLGVDAWSASRMGEIERLALDVVAGVLVYWAALQAFQVRAYRDVVAVLRQPAAVAKGVEGHAS